MGGAGADGPLASSWVVLIEYSFGRSFGVSSTAKPSGPIMALLSLLRCPGGQGSEMLRDLCPRGAKTALLPLRVTLAALLQQPPVVFDASTHALHASRHDARHQRRPVADVLDQAVF